MPEDCFCGCGAMAVDRHHVLYAQHLRGDQRKDARNLVPVARHCHGMHHLRQRPFRLSRMPDSVFEFAAEVMGAGAAYEYMKRRYSGPDARLDALLADYEREAA